MSRDCETLSKLNREKKLDVSAHVALMKRAAQTHHSVIGSMVLRTEFWSQDNVVGFKLISLGGGHHYMECIP